MELWNDGIMEYWNSGGNNGVMEWWDNGIME